MTVSSIPSSTPATSPVVTPPTAGNTTQSAQNQLTSNFSTFLTLLTTQLQNQDPLSPMDSSQFTSQLVQFSEVEQQIDSNQNLQTLIGLTQSQSGSYAVSYLGKTITTTDGTGALENGQANWAYSLNGSAANTSIMIQDANGNVVYTGAGEATSGMHSFSWNGQSNAGTQLPDGTYTLSVSAAASDGTAVPTQVASQGVVTEVDLSGTEPQLMVGPMAVPLSKATLISGN